MNSTKGTPLVISYRDDGLVLIPFLQAIKQRSSNPNLQINPIMTDDGNSGWNAFSRIFEDCTQPLRK